jgi:hypothetical protein
VTFYVTFDTSTWSHIAPKAWTINFNYANLWTPVQLALFMPDQVDDRGASLFRLLHLA